MTTAQLRSPRARAGREPLERDTLYNIVNIRKTWRAVVGADDVGRALPRPAYSRRSC